MSLTPSLPGRNVNQLPDTGFGVEQLHTVALNEWVRDLVCLEAHSSRRFFFPRLQPRNTNKTL